MNIRHFRMLGVAAVVLAVAGAAAVAATEQHYAIASSGSSLYMFRTVQSADSWGGKSWCQINTSFGSTGITGVAAYGNYVFVVDGSNNSLNIGRIDNILGSPIYNTIATVQLQNSGNTLHVQSPTAVAVSTSGAYVIGSSYYDGGTNHSCLAYVSTSVADWSSTAVQIVDLGANSGMADVAMLPNGSAIVARQGTGAPGQAHVSVLQDGAVTGSNSLGENCYSPQAVAVNSQSGKAYIVNRVFDTTVEGSLQTYDPASGATGGAGLALDPTMIPGDVVSFATGGEQYLGIIGRNGTSDEAWKVKLGASGSPDLDATTVSAAGSVAASTQHQAAASADGSVFWFTSYAAGKVDAWNSATWSPIAGFDGSLGSLVNVKYISDYNPTLLEVPEPSSFISLAMMAFGALGWKSKVRSRKSKVG